MDTVRRESVLLYRVEGLPLKVATSPVQEHMGSRSSRGALSSKVEPSASWFSVRGSPPGVSPNASCLESFRRRAGRHLG